MKIRRILCVFLLGFAIISCSSKPAVEKAVVENSDETLKKLHDAEKEDDGSAFRLLTVKGKDMDEATVKAAQKSLDAVMAERKDLQVREDGRSTIEVTLSPFEKNAYMVTLWVKRFQKSDASSSLITQKQSFQIRPGADIKSELSKKLKLLLPPAKK
jgi:hypothetical protein